MLKNGSKKGFLLVKIDFAFLPTTFIVYLALVHCRVGSLEKHVKNLRLTCKVHCRVGSLEMRIGLSAALTPVHCRVGSLEKIRHELQHRNPVHCRVGSLENSVAWRGNR